jgi:hypothetical protein
MTCPEEALVARPKLARFVYYKLLTLIPVSAALIAIVRYSGTLYWPLAYAALCLLHAGIMFSIKCPHCAYYKLPGGKLSCFMWWGAPKLYEPRDGPESKAVGVYAPIGMAVLTLFPIYWLRFEWELLALFLLSVVVVLLSIGQTECPRCLNFDCAHNRVPEDVREAYRESLPVVG